MDYHHVEINKEDDNYQNKKTKNLNGIKKSMKRNHMFRYLTRHAGKGQRDSVKRIHEIN